MTVAFKKATRQQVKLKLAITGPSGSGKTWGALELARGLGKKVAVIDTENGSASLYADRFSFDVIEMHAPYLTQKYSEALAAAVAGGYEVVVIDSITHEWAAEGGILDQKTQKDLRGGNSFTNWAGPSAEHEKWKAQLLAAPVHVIATIRSKSEYILETNDKGKQAPRKVGMAPIQRDGIEYEFSVVFDLALSHEAVASKDRTALFDGKHFRLSPEIGQELHKWMMSGEAPKPQAAPPPAKPKLEAVRTPTPTPTPEPEEGPSDAAPETSFYREMRFPPSWKGVGGKLLTEVPLERLRSSREYVAKTVNDPAKERFRDANMELLMGIDWAIDQRGA
jgi:hypothetical protein